MRLLPCESARASFQRGEAPRGSPIGDLRQAVVLDLVPNDIAGYAELERHVVHIVQRDAVARQLFSQGFGRGQEFGGECPRLRLPVGCQSTQNRRPLRGTAQVVAKGPGKEETSRRFTTVRNGTCGAFRCDQSLDALGRGLHRDAGNRLGPVLAKS